MNCWSCRKKIIEHGFKKQAYPKSGTILLLTIFNNRHSVAVIDSTVLAGGEVDIKGDPVAPLIVLQTRY